MIVLAEPHKTARKLRYMHKPGDRNFGNLHKASKWRALGDDAIIDDPSAALKLGLK